ncbi:MAG: tetratricopeptide repeat protein [Rhizobiales bacterium]|nr:tetratricopeptide repeat protein [Hyphomicrobiales bacterium]
MTSKAYGRQESKRRLGSVAVAILLAAGGAGCGTLAPAITTSSVPAPATPSDPRQASQVWGERYRANPGDAVAAINYARALRGIGQRAQAVAVLEQASIHNASNMDVLGAYGRALADVGNHTQALEVLARAHTPDRPDWRVLNAQGAVLDQLGRHQDAQRYYATALRIAPEEPSVLSNRGLSYALSKNLPEAEATLKRAVAGRSADPRVRQNLALVVGLQGRFAEAETIARADLPPEQAAANVAYLRQMLSQQNALEARTQPKRPAMRPAS